MIPLSSFSNILHTSDNVPSISLCVYVCVCICVCARMRACVHTHTSMLYSFYDLIPKVRDQIYIPPKTADHCVTELDAVVGPTSLLVTVVPNNQNTKYTGGSTGARPLPPDQLKCNILKGTQCCYFWALCFGTHESKAVVVTVNRLFTDSIIMQWLNSGLSRSRPLFSHGAAVWDLWIIKL